MAVGCCWVQVQTSATWLFVQRDEFLRFVVVWECSCRRRRLFVCLFVAVVKHCWSYIFFFAIYVFFFMFYSVIVNDQWRQKKIKKASQRQMQLAIERCMRPFYWLQRALMDIVIAVTSQHSRRKPNQPSIADRDSRFANIWHGFVFL